VSTLRRLDLRRGPRQAPSALRREVRPSSPRNAPRPKPSAGPARSRASTTVVSSSWRFSTPPASARLRSHASWTASSASSPKRLPDSAVALVAKRAP